MKKLILASGNAGKLREIQTILGPLGFSNRGRARRRRLGLHDVLPRFIKRLHDMRGNRAWHTNCSGLTTAIKTLQDVEFFCFTLNSLHCRIDSVLTLTVSPGAGDAGVSTSPGQGATNRDPCLSKTDFREARCRPKNES